MVLDTGNNTELLRYESCVVEDAGLLLAPLDSLLYELKYKQTAFSQKQEIDLKDDEIIGIIKDSKIPKEDILAAILLQPKLMETYGEGTEVFEYLKPF